MTSPHFSVSSATSLPKSAGESASTSPPRSARRALILGSARPALISLLSFSTISAGVAFGAPNQARGDVVPAASGGRNDHAHRPRRIGLRASNPRHGRQRGRARGQMQKLAAAKFHVEPPFTSFDHLVGAGEQRRRHLKAERLGGFQVDHELEFGCLIDR